MSWWWIEVPRGQVWATISNQKCSIRLISSQSASVLVSLTFITTLRWYSHFWIELCSCLSSLLTLPGRSKLLLRLLEDTFSPLPERVQPPPPPPRPPAADLFLVSLSLAAFDFISSCGVWISPLCLTFLALNSFFRLLTRCLCTFLPKSANCFNNLSSK